MGLWQQPHFKRKTWCIGCQSNEMLIFSDDPLPGIALLPDNVAKNAALFLVVIVPAIVDLFAHATRNDRQGDQLRVRMFQRSARCFAVIFENEDIAKALVVF